MESVVQLEVQWPDAPWPMDVVQALMDKSLLKMDNSRLGFDEPWFGMYSSVHEYAKGRLGGRESGF